MNYKFIAIVFLISSKLCFGQDGFRKELPFLELQLDTPFTFTDLNDFQIIDYGKDSIKGQLYYACKVNEKGNEQFCVQHDTDDAYPSFKRVSHYDNEGKLHSIKSYYPKWDEYEVSLFSYNSKGQKIKTELFNYKWNGVLKKGVFPDSIKYIGLDSLNSKKFFDRDNWNYNKDWHQKQLWTWAYDKKGRVIIRRQVDESNQKFTAKITYDKMGRILKELGYRDFDHKTTDSLTLITDYNYFSNGFVRTTKKWDGYFYIFIDTLITNDKDQIIKKISWWEYTDNAKPKPDEIPLTHIENIIIEYDSIGRKIKRTTGTDKYKYSEVYLYRNDSVQDMKQEEF